MHLSSQKRLIHTTTAAFALMVFGSAAWSLFPIGDSSEQEKSSTRNLLADRIADDARDTEDTATSSDIDFAMAMMRPLYDPPPPPPRKPVVKPPVSKPPPRPVVTVRKPKLDWTLVGTILDGEGNVAILTDPSGKTDVRREGETVDLAPAGVSVRKIDSDKVTLDVDGGESTLKLVKGFRSSGDGPGNRNGRRRDR